MAAIDFIHSRDIVHRDIKPANVLVSNLHYSSMETNWTESFKTKPIVCKLADLGEARSSVTQTRALLANSRTVCLGRGSPAFMAPEILVPECMLSSASMEQLKKVDVWATLMTIFTVINPDQRFPFQWDMKDFQQNEGNKASNSSELLKQFLREKKVPSFSDKYDQMQSVSYQSVRKLFLENLSYNPMERCSINELISHQKEDLDLITMPFSVSQSSALIESDCKVGQLIAGKSQMLEDTIIPPNDGTNACAFLAIGIIDKLMEYGPAVCQDMDNLVEIVSDVIINFPTEFNQYRDLSKLFDVYEAAAILSRHDLVSHELSFHEIIVNNERVYTSEFQKVVSKALCEFLETSEKENRNVFGIFQAGMYIFAIGSFTTGELAIFETHPINEQLGGNGNGLLVKTISVTQLLQWISKRLLSSAIQSDCTPYLLRVNGGQRKPLPEDYIRQKEKQQSSGIKLASSSSSGQTSSGTSSDDIQITKIVETGLNYDMPKTLPGNGDNNILHQLSDSSGDKDDSEVSEDEEDLPAAFSKAKEISYHNDDPALPIYAKGNNQPCSTREVMQLLTKGIKDHELVCKKPPVYVKSNVEFVVDATLLNDWRDIKTDMDPGMVRSATKSFYYDGTAFACSKDQSTHLVTRFVYGHKKHADFHKVIINIRDLTTNELLPLLYVQYYFENGEHDVDFNCQSKEGFKKQRRKTKFSVRSQIRSLSREGLKGKAIYGKLCKSAGGFDNARCSSGFPNSMAQIYDLARKDKAARKTDELMELIDLCKETNAQPNAFVREVRTAPEMSVVLANNRQLNDIRRFIASDHCWTILGVDPTFNICNYNVTVTTYRNPLLYVEGKDICPVLIGPILIHSHKTYESYYTLPATMVRLNPKLASLKAFGTDDETNVYKAFQTCFQTADHLLCWIHARDNIKKKLTQLGAKPSNEYMEDIFGKVVGDVKIKGLLDAETAKEFEEIWSKIEKKWEERGDVGRKFMKYIVDNKKEKMKKCMVSEVRKRCSLGDPPEEYRQNANECVNSLLKRNMEKKLLSLKETIQMVHQEVSIQDERMKLSLIGKGDWKIRNEYADKLQIDEEKYYKMSQAQRENATKKFLSFIPTPAKRQDDCYKRSDRAVTEIVIESTLPIISLSNVPITICEEIRSDAAKILTADGQMVHGPVNSAIYMITNEGKPSEPHPVKYDKKKGKANCISKECFRTKAFGVCSHSVAVAQKESFLSDFLHNLNKGKAKIPMISLADAGKEQKAGKKKTKSTQKRKGQPGNRKGKVQRLVDQSDNTTPNVHIDLSDKGIDQVRKELNFQIDHNDHPLQHRADDLPCHDLQGNMPLRQQLNELLQDVQPNSNVTVMFMHINYVNLCLL